MLLNSYSYIYFMIIRNSYIEIILTIKIKKKSICNLIFSRNIAKFHNGRRKSIFVKTKKTVVSGNQSYIILE